MEITSPPEQTESMQFDLSISGWMVSAVVLIVIALVLRLSLLGSVSITAPEAARALSAHDGVTKSIEQGNISDSPIVFWLQNAGLLIFGNTEVGVRIFVALAGAFLCLAPLMFASTFGQVRVFIMCVLFTFSPVMIIASRLSAPAVFSAWLAVLMLWYGIRYWQTNVMSAGVMMVVCGGALIALSEPGGLMLMLIVALSMAITVFLASLNAPDEQDSPGDEYLQSVFRPLRGLKLLSAIPIVLLIIVAVATAFLTVPAGMSMVGEVFNGFLAGFTQSATTDASFYFTFLVSVFYDFWLWILVGIAVFVITQRGLFDTMNRFFLVWIGVAALVAIIYPGAEAAHALWLTIPLVGLASAVITDAFVHEDQPVLWMGEFIDDDDIGATNLRAGKWIVAIVAFALLMLTAVHFQILVRGITDVPSGSLIDFFARFQEPAFNRVARSSIWFAIGVLFIIVGYFLAASIWGNKTTTRGGVIGLTVFVLLTGTASGWNASVTQANDPAELWHVHATHPDAKLFRQTMLDFAFRETGGFPKIPVVVVNEDDTGVIAWLLRDFENVRFVNTIEAAKQEQIVVIDSSVDVSDLGGNYVGQQFVISRRMPLSNLQGFDFLAWWADRSLRSTPQPSKSVIVWVRQDIFDSAPYDFSEFNVG